MSKDIVVRLTSSAGRSRLSLPATAALSDLQEKVKGVTGVDPASQKLAFDQNNNPGRPVSGAPTASLLSLGIVNGTQLHLLGAGATIAAQVLTKVPVPVEPEQPVPAANSGASGSGASSTAAPAAAAPAAASGSKPSGGGGIDPKEWSDKADRKAKFECFDTFIRNRRYETSNLQGNHVHSSIQLKAGAGMIKIPPSVSIKQQPYRHVDQVSIYNEKEIQNFMSHWWSDCLAEAQQRVGWLYGYYREDDNYGEKDRGDGTRVCVEGIYEPPQHMVGGDAVMQADDPNLATVNKIAEALGLECVGHVFTSFALDGDALLTPTEVTRMARLQYEHSTDAHFTKYQLSKFVSCAVRPGASEAPEVSSFMVSDQCSCIVRDKMINEDAGHKTDLVVREAQKGECMPTFLVEGKGNTNILTDFFVVRLVDAQPKASQLISMFTHHDFPRENRPLQKRVTRDDVKKYFKARSSKEPSWSRFADFHLLLYIAKEFGVENILPVCEAIRDRKEVPEGVKLLFESLVG